MHASVDPPKHHDGETPHDAIGGRHQISRMGITFQRHVDLASGETIGVKASLRYQHATLGVLGHAEVVRRAESTGVIHHVGRWALKAACKRLAEWRQMKERTHWTMAVKVSPDQLLGSTFLSDVLKPLLRYRLPPGALILEVNEQAIGPLHSKSAEKLHNLDELGVQCSLDEFGIGASNLLNLRKLPVKELKIDRLFVAGMESDEKSHAIVAAIAKIANALDLRLSAEGVENAEQRDLLIDMGCRLGRGSYFESLAPFLRERPASSQPRDSSGTEHGSSDQFNLNPGRFARSSSFGNFGLRSAY